MPRYKTISGTELVKRICKTFGYDTVSTKGSHQKLKLNEQKPLIVPLHKELKQGTLGSIVKQLSDYLNIPENDVSKSLDIN